MELVTSQNWPVWLAFGLLALASALALCFLFALLVTTQDWLNGLVSDRTSVNKPPNVATKSVRLFAFVCGVSPKGMTKDYWASEATRHGKHAQLFLLLAAGVAGIASALFWIFEIRP